MVDLLLGITDLLWIPVFIGLVEYFTLEKFFYSLYTCSIVDIFDGVTILDDILELFMSRFSIELLVDTHSL